MLTASAPIERDLVEVSTCCGAPPDSQVLRRCSDCWERASFKTEDRDAATSPAREALDAAAAALEESSNVIEALLARVGSSAQGRVRCEIAAAIGRNTAKRARAALEELAS